MYGGIVPNNFGPVLYILLQITNCDFLWIPHVTHVRTRTHTRTHSLSLSSFSFM